MITENAAVAIKTGSIEKLAECITEMDSYDNLTDDYRDVICFVGLIWDAAQWMGVDPDQFLLSNLHRTRTEMIREQMVLFTKRDLVDKTPVEIFGYRLELEPEPRYVDDIYAWKSIKAS